MASIIDKCLAKDKDECYQDAASLLAVLGACRQTPQADQKPLFRLLGALEADKKRVLSIRPHGRATLSDEEISDELGLVGG